MEIWNDDGSALQLGEAAPGTLALHACRTGAGCLAADVWRFKAAPGRLSVQAHVLLC